MFKLVGISLILAVIQISESGPVYQFLPPREGYIPVYIRLGDTPLDEINPDLALAFHESNIESRNILDEEMQNDAPINDDVSESVEDVKEKISIEKDSNSEEEEKTEVKSTDDEANNEEQFKPPQKKSTTLPKKEVKEIESEEEPALTQQAKDNDSEEVLPTTTTTTTTAKPEPPLRETNNGVRITPPEDYSSEEFVDKTGIRDDSHEISD